MVARLSIVGCVIAGLALVYPACAAAAARGTPQGSLGARVLRFPPDRSLGTLMTQPARSEVPLEGFLFWIRGDE